ncbi:prolyl 3-hydroxylase 1-like isoform X3 [Ruditapes philippinarum]|uniref:prolyl 3-hydroxylase 1-like isoform X3 n=1 Tax=Ruditapes philippinarum TaxID=129788 RepID=UPI00295C106F|nr:prolyl 3-hydroxylase 1-like isoform X3 [Ruditapes philippinarum]
MRTSLAAYVPFLITLVESLMHDRLTNYAQYYDLGMDAYRQEKWPKCAEFFQRAIDDFHFFKDTVIDCRLNCKKGQPEFKEISHQLIFHDILERSNCLRRCKKKKLGDRAEEEIEMVYDKKFEERTPYNFMQFCYFKGKKLTEAAAAAYTYFITHQDDTRILENLQYYRTLPELKETDFVDLERKEYQKQYVKALNAYNQGNWDEAAATFEESLRLYFIEEEKCRAGCEKGFRHNRLPDFFNAIGDHYVAVLVCQQKCLKKLSTFGMEELENFVQEHYNYLQYAYYEANNLEKAFESIANYLLFRPFDDEMLANKDYYIRTLRHKETEFVPSAAAAKYVELWRQIDESISYIREKYTLPSDQIAEENIEESGSNSNDVADSSTVEGSVNRSENVKGFEKIGVKLLQDSKQLNGQDRFLADGFIREDQCEALADLARRKEFDKFGYREVTVSEVIELIKVDKGYEISLRLLLRAAEVMKIYTSTYFSQSELLLHDVKLNCRSAGADLDYSLPSDCVLQENGDCKMSQVNNADDYIIVAYLTDMVDSTGQFYFTDENGEVQASIQPLCGLMVGFSAADMHRVNVPWKHERCAIVLSLTKDESLKNSDVEKAKETLLDLEERRVAEFIDADNSDILKEFSDQGVKITQRGEDLLGKERFVADGLVTEEECQTLIQLARREGVSGDGYSGRVSPHTHHEIYTGLDVARGEQKGVTKGDGYHDNRSTSKFVSPYTQSESFEGLNISKSLQLVKERTVLPETLHLFLDASEHSRLLVEKYLNLTRPLYFDYTHLVCRTAVDGDTDDREADLSHPVHFDNGMIQPDGSCIPDAFAYVQRNYSGVLYLNDNFEGGQFFFAHKNKSEQISVKPQCGRFVAFNAGDYHGVKAVVKGQRCAIAMWFTHDPNFVEVSRLHAHRSLEILTKLKKKTDDPLTEDVTNVDIESEIIDVTTDLESSLDENHDEL